MTGGQFTGGPAQNAQDASASLALAETAAPTSVSSVSLVLLRDAGDRRRFDLSGDTTIIGRREDCDLRIPLGDVSRRHCSLMHGSGGELRLQDLGSSNGTYVNGHRVQESPLLAGDFIQIGSLKFLVQVDGQPADADAVPSRRPVAGSDELGQAPALNPTAQADVADFGLDPSDAAAPMDELMDD